MQLQDMIAAVNRLVDDVPAIVDIVQWLNAGQNDIAVELEAAFPQLNPSVMTGTFVFPERFHEIPVLYAAARYKEQDTSLQEAQNFMQQYLDKKKWMVLNYEVPMQYRDDAYTQQFVGDGVTTTFTITKQSYDDRTGNLKIYINNVLLTNVYANNYQVMHDGSNTFVLTTAPALNATITANWEQHNDWNEPPFSWWA